MSFTDKMKQQEADAKKEGFASSGGGDWYKMREGDNRFRVLVEPEMIFEKYKVGICYTDCGYEGTAKFMTYLLDRRDGKIKIAKIPYIVGTTIGGYETDAEYKFEGFPMPFDVNVKADDKVGTKDVKYTVIAGRANTEVDAVILAELAKRKPIADIIQKMKDNKKEEHIADGTWQANQDRKEKLKEELDAVRPTGDSGDGYLTQEEVDEISF